MEYIAAQRIAQTLYYFKNPGDHVLDPMAGGNRGLIPVMVAGAAAWLHV